MCKKKILTITETVLFFRKIPEMFLLEKQNKHVKAHFSIRDLIWLSYFDHLEINKGSANIENNEKRHNITSSSSKLQPMAVPEVYTPKLSKAAHRHSQHVKFDAEGISIVSLLEAPLAQYKEIEESVRGWLVGWLVGWVRLSCWRLCNESRVICF